MGNFFFPRIFNDDLNRMFFIPKRAVENLYIRTSLIALILLNCIIIDWHSPPPFTKTQIFWFINSQVANGNAFSENKNRARKMTGLRKFTWAAGTVWEAAKAICCWALTPRQNKKPSRTVSLSSLKFPPWEFSLKHILEFRSTLLLEV